MRKILCVLLAMVLAVGVCAPPALAAETPTVSISSGTVAPGGDVTLTVSIKDNPGLCGTILHVFFDTSVFEADPEEDLRAVGGFTSGMVIGNTLSLALQNGYTDCPLGSRGVLLMWFDATGADVHGNGECFKVTLHAKESARTGEYKIELGYSQENTRNEQDEEIALKTLGGTVTITGSGTQTNPGGTTGNDPGGSTGNNPGGATGNNPGGQTGSDETVELFSDVAGNWAEAYIDQAAERKLIQGYEGKYRPQDSMTRAELVTILWRANGSPEAKASSFTDLTQDWYKDAIAWAEETGVVNGLGDGRFDPEGHITREQLAAILHRMAGSPTGLEAMLTGLYDQQFTDSAKVSSWAKASMYWTYYTEILCGNEKLDASGELAPQADATRAQIAVMIVRYLDRMEKGG